MVREPWPQYLARTPLSVRFSREAGLAHLSVELDSEDVVGVTVVADLRPLLEMVDVHALRHRGTHHHYQTAGEETLHDVNVRSFCWGQRPSWLIACVCANRPARNKWSWLLIINQIFLLSCATFHSCTFHLSRRWLINTVATLKGNVGQQWGNRSQGLWKHNEN